MRKTLPRVLSGISILAVAAVAGIVSYIHIYELSVSLHQDLFVARLMPFGVDGLITIGSVVLLQGINWGWLGLGPGVTISLFANVESGIPHGALAAAWAGIPAVSFALSCFILERWLLHQAKTEVRVPAPARVPKAAPVVVTPPEPAPSPAVDGLDLKRAARVFAAEIERGHVPGLNAIRTAMKPCGPAKARDYQAYLSTLVPTE